MLQDEAIIPFEIIEPFPHDAATPSKAERRRAYEQKFSDFLFLLRATNEENIIVHHPQVLGDSYEELVESLDRLADAGKKLVIVPRNERG